MITGKRVFTAFGAAFIGSTLLFGTDPAPAPNGMTLPKGYQNWQLISSSIRTDNKTMRVILGNDTAIRASKENRTRPWPKGTVLAKLVWKQQTDSNWPSAIVPGEFIHVEFMFKDEKKYADTGGWGYARWLGTELKPYGKDKNFAHECYSCHLPVKSNDYVYTHPSILP